MLQILEFSKQLSSKIFFSFRNKFVPLFLYLDSTVYEVRHHEYYYKIKAFRIFFLRFRKRCQQYKISFFLSSVMMKKLHNKMDMYIYIYTVC